MHALDKTVLTMSAQTERGHAFLKHLGADEKHCTVEQQAVLPSCPSPRPLISNTLSTVPPPLPICRSRIGSARFRF
jgi:hypothetical protein